MRLLVRKPHLVEIVQDRLAFHLQLARQIVDANPATHFVLPPNPVALFRVVTVTALLTVGFSLQEHPAVNHKMIDRGYHFHRATVGTALVTAASGRRNLLKNRSRLL